MKKLSLLLAILTAALTLGCQNGAGGDTQLPVRMHEAPEGVINGGGGKGVKCGSIVTTLDLWEAVNVHRLTLQPALSSLDEELIRFSYRYIQQTQPQWSDPTPQNDQAFLSAIKTEIFGRQVFISPGKRLSFTNDATLPALPSNCEFVQIAIYANDGKIYFDSEYWSLLNPQAQASLAFHELAYLQSRTFGHLNSDEARSVVGRIFSTLPVDPNFPDLRGKRYAWCGAGGGDNAAEVFEIYFNEEVQGGISGLGVYFSALNGEYMLTKTSGFLPRLTLSQVSVGDFPATHIQIYNPVRDETLNFEMGLGAYPGSVKLSDLSPFVRAWKPGEAVPVESWALCREEM